MNYLSVCSGIEAATVAWHHLGWKPLAFSEIEPFPSAVLAHHYPHVTNLGNMTQFKEWNLGNESIDVLAGGTPCQSFSVAGLRQGLKDPRGNLMLVYLAIAERFRPKWIVWENVPGVLSSNKGRDFGTFLGALVNLGYGFAYRVLDAQWFGVAQRRRRVFVVGCFGDATSAAKVLFESESVCRNPAPSREKGQGIATNVAPSLTASNDPSRSPQSSEITQQVNAILEAQVAACLRSGGNGGVPSSRGEHLVYHAPITGTLAAVDGPKGVSDQYAHEGKLTVWRGSDNTNAETCINHAGTLTCDRGQRGGIIATAFHPTQDPISSENISHALATGSKSGNATTAVAFQQNTRDEVRYINGDGQIVGALSAEAGMKQQNYIAQPIPIDSMNHLNRGDSHSFGDFQHGAPSYTLTKGHHHAVAANMTVRRLTPIECERLQGFPDNYTAITWRKKPADQCPDGPRYKALGNSMAVPVMRWIGERIDKLEKGAAP